MGIDDVCNDSEGRPITREGGEGIGAGEIHDRIEKSRTAYAEPAAMTTAPVEF